MPQSYSMAGDRHACGKDIAAAEEACIHMDLRPSNSMISAGLGTG